MAVGQERLNTIYGFPGPLDSLPLPTLVYNRPPTNMDYGIPSQQWLDTSVIPSVMYYMSNNAAGLYNWVLLETSGSGGVFSSLTVTPGPISLTGTTTINTSGSAVTTIGTGGTGAVHIGNATGNTSVTGTLSATGTISSSAGSVTAFLGVTGASVTATSGDITATLGNIAASNGTVTGDTGVIATTGNITATDGNVVLSTAGTYISMPGPVFIYSGAGAPANGLALHVGDMYINTTAASATTRLYIATAASTWTNVTCAA